MDEEAVLDARAHQIRATGKMEADWAAVVMSRASRYRTRSMNFSRLKKRAPAVKTSAEAGVLVADRLNDLEDTIRGIVSGSAPPPRRGCLPNSCPVGLWAFGASTSATNRGWASGGVV